MFLEKACEFDSIREKNTSKAYFTVVNPVSLENSAVFVMKLAKPILQPFDQLSFIGLA